MPKWIKITLGIFFSAVIVISAGLFIYYQMLLKSLPDYKGVKEFKGLTGKVEIFRDKFGIPFIFSQNDYDAAYALGYVHAQERLFQMDVLRRAGEGRLSEIFGTKTIMYDEMFLTLGIGRVAKEILKQLDPKTKSVLEAYTKGVNAYINEYNGKYPFEFDILQYNPYPWKPEHSLVIGKLMAWELDMSWWVDVVFANLINKFGESKVKEITPDYPENAPTIIPPEFKNYPKISTAFMEINKSFKKFLQFEGTHIGSNNWVISGKKSVTGKPIIANDPHLAFQAPAKWYIAVIKGNEWIAEGVTLPGLPAIVIGKNRNISWTVTNVMADDADFYIEHLDSTGKKYLVNGIWKDLNISDYTILVKDSSDINFRVRETYRGPIISDIHMLNKEYPVGKYEQADLSMHWTGSEVSNELKSFYLIDCAKNWNDFKDAVKYFWSPGQNFVYGDKDGNIGYICGVKLPIRASANHSFVYDGSTTANDWKGYVSYSEMPAMYNPPENYIASANNKVVKNFPYYISNFWEPPSRIERITELLNLKQKYSIKDFMKYQMDITSPYAKEILPYVISAFKDINIKDNNLKLALELFSEWNFSMGKFSQVPSIFNVFLYHLMRNIFEDEMGKNLFEQYVFIANVPYKTVTKLLKENNSPWFDNVTTGKIETRDDIIRESLSDALTYLENRYGTDAADWQWGELHKLINKHILHGALPILDRFFDVGPFYVGGDGTTLFNTEYSFNDPYETTLGQSMRYLFDFSVPNEFYIILPTGQSGNILSDHYKDMSDMWLTGGYLKINTDESYIRNSDYDLLILK